MAGPLNISEFKSKLAGGQKATLFKVVIPKIDASLNILAKAASLPGAELGVAEAHHFGRIVPIPGDRVFADWSVTFYNDADMNIYKKMTEWSNDLNDFVENDGDVVNQANYSDITVSALKRDGTTEPTSYKLIDAWPLNINPIDFSAESRDTLTEFQVTFKYLHYEKVK